MTITGNHETSTPDPTPLPPDLLLEKLRSTASRTGGTATLESLADELACSPAAIADALAHPDVLHDLDARTRLAHLQARYMAVQYLPHALARTVNLLHESEKPEVARRSASALLQIAGISTRTSPQAPYPAFPGAIQPAQAAAQRAVSPVPSPEPNEAAEYESNEMMAAVAFILHTKRAMGLDLSRLEDSHYHAFVNVLDKFMEDNNIPHSRGFRSLKVEPSE